MSVSEIIQEQTYYRSQHWMSQVARYPFIQHLLRVLGYQPALVLETNLQLTMGNLRSQIAAIMGFCPCKFDLGGLYNIEPKQPSTVFTNVAAYQAIIDLQTGDLWIHNTSLTLGRDQYTDWQYYIQFSIQR